MKKTITILLGALLLASTPALAKDKAVVKFGPIKFKSTTSGDSDSVVGVQTGNNIQITVGGSSGTTNVSSGTFTIFFLASELDNFTKGYKLDLASIGDDTGDGGEAIVTFLGTKIQIKGFSSTTTGIASVNESEALGTFTVLSYDPTSKVLKFKLAGKVQPYSSSKTKLGQTPNTVTVNKPLAVNVTGEVTLEI